ncbi:ras-like protein family member 11A-like isoform X2 [Dreissena polymorpha]|uniref:ras-like protein family member 11A-like isoform X2 n=1 Tax=Dreissena polymorpha TaxID=45954 RepID=UPI00226464F3|nr:ras-like protein family member 11A-like isoform X2 [Dreissena polymorpha]
MSVEGNLDRVGHRSPRARPDTPPRHAHSSGKEVNILVLGYRGVGKTEMLYSHSTCIEGKHLTLHIIDTLGQMTADDISQHQVLWADCVIIVFAITMATSFQVARTLVEYVHKISTNRSIPVALVANKSDMIERKTVSDTEISRLCAEYNLLFFETSASEGRTSMNQVFVTLAQQVRHILKKKEKLTRFMQNPAVAAKLQIQQSFRNLAQRAWRTRTSTL